MIIKQKTEVLLPKQEKNLRKAIWWIVRELHQESDASMSEDIKLFIQSNKETPSLTEQRRALRFLENLKIIEIQSTKLSTTSYGETLLRAQNEIVGLNHQPVYYDLKLDKPALIDLYTAYDIFFNNEKYDFIAFDSRSGVLKYEKVLVSFDPSSQSFTILDILLNNTDSFYALGDTLSFKEINSLATQDGSVKEIPEKSFYNTLKHINEKVKKETRIDKFLVLRAAEIGINSKLLKKSERI